MWKNIFKHIESSAEAWLEKSQSRELQVDDQILPVDPQAARKEFLRWGEVFLEELKQKQYQQELADLKESFFSILKSIGLSEEQIQQKSKALVSEDLESLHSEISQVFSKLLAWTSEASADFLKCLEELKVSPHFAKLPFLYIIAICSLAWGYNSRFCKNTKEVTGSVGFAVQWLRSSLSPMAFIGTLVVVSAAVYFNYSILKEKNIEGKISDILNSFLKADIFLQMKAFWQEFENFMSDQTKK